MHTKKTVQGVTIYITMSHIKVEKLHNVFIYIIIITWKMLFKVNPAL